MIFVLSGTKDGRLIANLLEEKGYAIIVSTATLHGKTLIQGNNNSSNIPVVSGLLDTQGMIDIIRKKVTTQLSYCSNTAFAGFCVCIGAHSGICYSSLGNFERI